MIEFQGGAPDPWGGAGENACARLVNSEAARVVYKNLYSIGVKILNIYMVSLPGVSALFEIGGNGPFS